MTARSRRRRERGLLLSVQKHEEHPAQRCRHLRRNQRRSGECRSDAEAFAELEACAGFDGEMSLDLGDSVEIVGDGKGVPGGVVFDLGVGEVDEDMVVLVLAELVVGESVAGWSSMQGCVGFLRYGKRKCRRKKGKKHGPAFRRKFER